MNTIKLTARLEYISQLMAFIAQLQRKTDLLELNKRYENYLRLLRNGHLSEEIILWAKDHDFKCTNPLSDTSPSTLSFFDLTRFNTWFELHPEKVAGKEYVTTSRDFPIRIKGGKEEVQSTLSPIKLKQKIAVKSKAVQLKLKILEMKISANYALSGITDEVFFQGLGDLLDEDKSLMKNNYLEVKQVIAKSEKEQSFRGKLLSFNQVDTTYNQGISEGEKKVWVWYKRSLGYVMKGWEQYYTNDKSKQTSEVLRAVRDAVIKDNTWKDINSIKKGSVIGKPTRFSHEYRDEKYIIFIGLDGNKYLIKEKDVQREKTGHQVSERQLMAWVKDGLLYYSDGEYLPYPIYAYGNMYDRELQLEKDAAEIKSKYGDKVFQAHSALIQKLKPAIITVTHANPSERPKILCISKFAREFLISGLREDSGVVLNSNEESHCSLVDAFSGWLRSLEKHHFEEVTAFQIISYYINGKKLSRSLSDEEKSTIEKYGRIEGEQLFSKFLNEAVLPEDQRKIDFKWNREYNGFSSVPYHRVPVGFSCSSHFKSFHLEFTPAQREAIAFMEIAGSGVIAYDVGVGKTMSAIITVANTLYSGKCKRPLIVVPNPTYKKWIREIIGYKDDTSGEFIPGVMSHTGVTLNEWYNLGKGITGKVNLKQVVKENSITVMTYEGFSKIGFSMKVMKLLFDELSKILAQENDDRKSQRDLEMKYQSYRELIGLGLKNTVADIDSLGFDYIVIDEAHNFKNVFDQVPADEEGVKRYKITGSQSARAVKAFFLCNYIQRMYGGNVMLLTATPFTNSPLEIYSMLSLVGYESMCKMGITSVERFMETFVLQSLEYVNSYDDTIKEAPVVKSFNNRLVLQRLIHNHIAYKTGEEAGVKRPCKVNLPMIYTTNENGDTQKLPSEQQVVTYLKMTQQQMDNQAEIISLAKNGSAINGDVMRAMGRSLDNALSPFLYKFNRPPEDYKDYVEGSPKIHYVMECVKSVRSYHVERNEEVSGQVIYMNRGKDYFPLIKEYLEEEIGYATRVKFQSKVFDEVEIISSGISAARKEALKDAFLEGKVKVIIGTATIREGIDLQKKGTVIYNLYPDWNPTDVKQLEGRIWRQGNEFGYVRSVMPLVENSMDVFVFQKLEEKTSRVNDIWYKGDRGNVIDLESLDPEEVKFALFTNIDALTKLEIDKERKEIKRKQAIALNNVEVIKRFKVTYSGYLTTQSLCREGLAKTLDHFKVYFFESSKAYENALWFHSKTEAKRKTFIGGVELLIKEVEQFLESTLQEDKLLLQLGRKLVKVSYDVKQGLFALENHLNRFRDYLYEVRKAEKSLLQGKGLTLDDNLDEIISAFDKELTKATGELQSTESQEYFEKKKQEVKFKKEKMAISGKTAKERAKDFSSLNYLLSYKATDMPGQSCALPLKEREPIKKADLNLIKVKAKALKLKLSLLQL